jgi:hypothetical protein
MKWFVQYLMQTKQQQFYRACAFIYTNVIAIRLRHGGWRRSNPFFIGCFTTPQKLFAKQCILKKQCV